MNELTQIAREIWAENQDMKISTDMMVKRILKDAAMVRRWSEYTIREVAAIELARQKQTERRRIVEVVGSGKKDVVALASGVFGMLGFPLPSGKRLGDATSEDLRVAIDHYQKQSSDMRHKAEFLRSISQSLQPGQKVGDVISDRRAVELFNATRLEKTGEAA